MSDDSNVKKRNQKIGKSRLLIASLSTSWGKSVKLIGT
ncbi:hypothetical protein CKA32_006830 [Geitlerinema sp. FC II]|nr:hypothetical protein CKA32_006830 [Geitlerinema sp. FC II]